MNRRERQIVLASALAGLLLVGGCDWLDWWQGFGGGGGGGGEPHEEPADPCALYDCEAAEALWAPAAGGQLEALCGARVYDMRPIVDCCGFKAGVEAALADTCGGRHPAASARVLWFPPGGDYLVDEPVELRGAGLVLRGEGAAVTELGEDEWDRGGTVFRCAVGEGQRCLTLARADESLGSGGVVFERIQMRWEGAAPAPAGVVGLALHRVGGAVVRDAAWDDFPGTSLLVEGGGGSFERLAFLGREGGHSETALALRCVRPEEGGGLLCPNGAAVGPVRVSHHDWGLSLWGGNATTIRDGSFTHLRRNAILIDGAEAIRIEGCRFQDAQEGLAEDLAWVRLQRGPGAPWYPDAVLDGNYFQCNCREGRVPVAAWAASTMNTPVGRVSLVDNTFSNCRAGLLSRAAHDGASAPDTRTQWLCARNRVLQRISSAPVVWRSWILDDCATDASLPEIPVGCE